MVFRKRCVNFTAWTHKSQNRRRAKHMKKYQYFRRAEAEEVSMLYLQSCADELSTEVSMLCNCPCWAQVGKQSSREWKSCWMLWKADTSRMDSNFSTSNLQVTLICTHVKCFFFFRRNELTYQTWSIQLLSSHPCKLKLSSAVPFMHRFNDTIIYGLVASFIFARFVSAKLCAIVLCVRPQCKKSITTLMLD